MSAQIRARWVIVHKAPVILIRGKDSGNRLRAFRFKPLWSASGRGWVIDDQHLADVAAIAGMETIGYRVSHEDGSECQCVDLRADKRQVDADPSELCLCDNGFNVGPLELLGAVEIGHVHRSAS